MLKQIYSTLTVIFFLFIAFGSESNNGSGTKDNNKCNNDSYKQGYKIGKTVNLLNSSESCTDFVENFNYETGRMYYKADECFCEGFDDGKKGLNLDKYNSLENGDLDKNNINTQDQPIIVDIESKNDKTIQKAKINFDSHPDSEYIKDRYSTDYYNNEINFAKYYIIITSGCGTGCSLGYLFDTRDGKIYDLPTYGDFEGTGTLTFDINSNDLISEFEVLSQEKVIKTFWKFNEKNKSFKFINEREEAIKY
ncbi:hypothetical protein [Empedobacter falsenii]